MYSNSSMKNNRIAFGLVAVVIGAVFFAGFVFDGPAMAQSATPPAATPAPAANLNQLMRSLYFPHSNVVFFAQRYDPATVKRDAEPSAATDPLLGVFGGWEAVENSALTLADSADLLMTPGRKCSNGRDVPVERPDWAQLVKGLREASMVAYKAALTKNTDKMLDASDVLAQSCANCHGKYRPGNAANRCK